MFASAVWVISCTVHLTLIKIQHWVALFFVKKSNPAGICNVASGAAHIFKLHVHIRFQTVPVHDTLVPPCNSDKICHDSCEVWWFPSDEYQAEVQSNKVQWAGLKNICTIIKISILGDLCWLGEILKYHIFCFAKNLTTNVLYIHGKVDAQKKKAAARRAAREAQRAQEMES